MEIHTLKKLDGLFFKKQTSATSISERISEAFNKSGTFQRVNSRKTDVQLVAMLKSGFTHVKDISFYLLRKGCLQTFLNLLKHFN